MILTSKKDLTLQETMESTKPVNAKGIGLERIHTAGACASTGYAANIREVFLERDFIKR